MLVMTSSLAGILFSFSLRERVEMLKQLSDMLDEIILHIRWGAATVQEITDILVGSRSYTLLGFLPLLDDKSTADFTSRWQTAVDEWDSKRYPADREMIRSLVYGLGESDTEGQLSWYMQKKAGVDAAAVKAGEDYNRKGKLYRTLGVLCGVFIAVVMA